MDKITEERIKTLHPILRDEAFEIYSEIEKRLTGGRIIARLSDGYRSIQEQDLIYAIGRTVKGKNPTPKKPMGETVTFARGGQSYHNFGLATDTVILIDKDGNGTFETVDYSLTADHDKDGMPEFEEIDFVFSLYGWKGLYYANGQRWDFPHRQKTFGYSIKQLQQFPQVNGYPRLPGL